MSDLIVASAVLVLGAPLWLLIGAVIRLTTRGPALYRAVQIGFGCEKFTYYKFRTMRQGSDKQHRDWLKEFVLEDRPYMYDDQGRPVYKDPGDQWVTPIGHWLRRTSLDEVPQFLNVLRGEMSVVGPRPTHPGEFEHFDEYARRRLAVKPGITGLYQVTGRGRVPFSQVLSTDLDYIRRRSSQLDLSIMARTIGVILTGRGAA